MAKNMKEELDIEAILPSSTVEDTFTIYIREEDVKMDNEEIKGKRQFYRIKAKITDWYLLCFYLHAFY